MSHTSILADASTIHNFVSKLCPPLYFSEPARKRIANFIAGTSQKGYRGKVTDLVELGFASCHRTTFGHFLSKGIWDESYLWKAMKEIVLAAVQKAAQQTTEPIFTIYDDIISKKTKPSSQASHPIEATEFHFSHLDCKTVWGHQLLAGLLSVGSLTLPYYFEHYERGSISKINRVCQIASSLPTAKVLLMHYAILGLHVQR